MAGLNRIGLIVIVSSRVGSSRVGPVVVFAVGCERRQLTKHDVDGRVAMVDERLMTEMMNRFGSIEEK